MWYSAKILYESQIDGDSNVEPRMSEESIIVIEAENDGEAEKKLSNMPEKQNCNIKTRRERMLIGSLS